ncbi:MAG: enoyl-CoA hydratase-related protein [Cyclobacteriaceae bacterium]|nr:enoyl-CoA hydratase-related protein [Cyclobacteriaceae bacterium]
MEYLHFETRDRIGYITLNRPAKRNALNFEMVSELRGALKDMAEDDDIRVIVINARGKAFCAGADLAYLQQMQNNTYEENLADSRHLMELYYTIYTLNKVVIAQVQGYAIAGGCGLASVCDFVFATPDAKFGYTEVKIGFVPAIVMVFLLRRMSERHARELLLTGDIVDVKKALDIGLINEIVPSAEIGARVDEYAMHLIESNSGQAIALTKQMIAAVQSSDLKNKLHYAAETNARARNFTDCRAGIAAFLNKEEISW